MSKNVRAEIQNALERKRMPVFSPGSIRDLALKLGMPFPVSLLNLLRVLDNLLSAGVIYDSGRFAAGTVHASAQLYLQSDGGVLFSGQAHESGVVGDNFVLVMALLDVKDDAGNTLVFSHSDTLAGQPLIGFSDKEWHTPTFNQLVKDKWNAVKNTRVETRLHVSTDPWQVTELSVAGIFALAGVIFGGKEVVTCPEDEEWVCDKPRVGVDPSGDPNRSPGVSVEIYCECRKKSR